MCVREVMCNIYIEYTPDSSDGPERGSRTPPRAPPLHGRRGAFRVRIGPWWSLSSFDNINLRPHPGHTARHLIS